MNKNNRNTISAFDISRKYNLSYQTVNYYTNLDLLTAFKNQGNKRLYDAQLVEDRLRQIQSLKSEGYPLRLIKKKILSHELL